MKRFSSLLIFVFTLFLPLFSHAHAEKLYLKMDSSYQTWEVDSAEFSGTSSYQKTALNHYDILPLAEQQQWLEPYLENQEVEGVDQVKIQQYLQEKIAPEIARERSDVTISKNKDTGKIEFDGIGLESRQLDTKKAAEMIAHALEAGVDYVHLPLINEPPVVTVSDEELKKMGITEVIGEGQSDASRSPANRYHNIDTGLARFNGYLIQPDEEFSFTKILGPVDASTGYLPELVIKGPKTIPEYGGGLCQVSSTMFRSVLDTGLPITARQNHSYLVSHYYPPGTDATVYVPNPDFRFINDTGHPILIQTARFKDDVYYILYGTKDHRTSHVMGPFYKGWTGIPAPKVEYTDTLPPGAVKIVGNAVPGLHVTWYREITYGDGKTSVETYDSLYQARPFYKLIGGAAPAPAAEGGGEAPAE